MSYLGLNPRVHQSGGQRASHGRITKQGRAHDTEGMGNAVIDGLEGHHLLRGEERAGAHWYELSHDKFVEAIRAGNRETVAEIRSLR